MDSRQDLLAPFKVRVVVLKRAGQCLRLGTGAAAQLCLGQKGTGVHLHTCDAGQCFCEVEIGRRWTFESCPYSRWWDKRPVSSVAHTRGDSSVRSCCVFRHAATIDILIADKSEGCYAGSQVQQEAMGGIAGRVPRAVHFPDIWRECQRRLCSLCQRLYTCNHHLCHLQYFRFYINFSVQQ